MIAMSHKVFPPAMRHLINELSRLPSVGEKSATRFAYHLITTDKSNALALSQAIAEARERIGYCKSCFGFAESELCSICADPKRNRSIICVVEKPADIIALERTSGFHGLYHVLHGLWSPLRGVRPEDTKINELIQRVKVSDNCSQKVSEIIIATSTTIEGDATAMFISGALEGCDLNISRIARGMPKGGDLEYADEITISYALEGRRRYHPE